MRKVIPILVLALGLAACSQAQLTAVNTALDKYDAAIQNFNAASARVSQSIALTDNSLKPYCTGLQGAGANLTKVVSGNDSALKVLDTSTAALNSYCGQPVQNINDAAITLTATIAAAKQAYQNAKH